MTLRKDEPKMYFKWLSIFRKEVEELLKYQSKIKSTSARSKASNLPSANSYYPIHEIAVVTIANFVTQNGIRNLISLITQIANAMKIKVEATNVTVVRTTTTHLIRRIVVNSPVLPKNLKILHYYECLLKSVKDTEDSKYGAKKYQKGYHKCDVQSALPELSIPI